VGQGEFPPGYLAGAGAINAAPGSCQSSTVAGLQLPYCHDLNVNVHHNAVTLNISIGDELFSPRRREQACQLLHGADFYKFNYNWVCGNLSTGDGGGLGHIGSSTTATSSTTRSCSIRAPTRRSHPTAAASSSWAS